MRCYRVIRVIGRDQSKKLCLRCLFFVFAALLFGGSVFTGAAAAGSRETLIITGTGASIGAMQLLAKDFQKKHPEVNVAVLPSIGSAGGIKAVREGRIGIGLLARRLKPEEQSGAIIEEAYGRTAFIFGVQDPNPIEDLTLAEIAEIYAGKRQTWSDGTPIRLILRPLSDAYSVYLASINPGIRSAAEKAHAIPGVFVGNTDQEAAWQIEKTPGSFGTTSGSLIAAEGRRIKALSVDGAAPTGANIAAGKYPFVMTLYLAYKKDKYRGVIGDFVEFVFSRDGQKLLSENGHVTLPRIAGK